jgi:hypothetical protein
MADNLRLDTVIAAVVLTTAQMHSIADAEWTHMQLDRWRRARHGEPPFPVDPMAIELQS